MDASFQLLQQGPTFRSRHQVGEHPIFIRSSMACSALPLCHVGEGDYAGQIRPQAVVHVPGDPGPLQFERVEFFELFDPVNPQERTRV